MKNSVFSLIVLSFVLFASCSSDKSKEYDINKDTALRDMMDSKDCFAFIYPLGAILPDGSTIIGDSEDDFFSKLKVWYSDHPDSKEQTDLVYPVQVSFGEDITKVIEDTETMKKLKDYCDKGDKDYNTCFDLVYPLEFIMPDESIVTGTNKEELNAAIKAWYEAHPDSKEKYDLVYPVDATLENGETTTINNEEEMIALKIDC